jgi:hypothetical protein
MLCLVGGNDSPENDPFHFYSLENWQEIPDEVNLAPGVTVAIPKPRLTNSLDIWPLSHLNLKDVNYD